MCKMIDDHLKRVERLSEQVDVIAEIQDEDRNKEIKHPLLQGTYTGVRTTILGNLFFPPFLTKTKRE